MKYSVWIPFIIQAFTHAKIGRKNHKAWCATKNILVILSRHTYQRIFAQKIT
ncbi:hypothetical protein PRABACTJOHN_03001 [Parabacteroides johnsonii DSM 18315]|jgi:hypothetical protein|uniref:Uncharacterized protein n=1 Tax=Parabacteroides johnsonii DSM 18315 TaxID=537006 RepID=B7BD82_9BACT|nr:hypothetical protein PRABACTJOHN_03001 [Parabacteroides johnsonii DSM 18315]